MNILEKENNNSNSLKLKYKLTKMPEEVDNNELNFNFTYISSLSSKKKPDIYTKEGFLQSRNYKILTKSNDNVNCDNTKDNIQKEKSISDDDDFTKVYNEVNKLDVRYFSNNNLTIICFNCKEIGHMAKSCPNPKIIKCDRCKEEGHTSYECNNIKCFKCNKIGHRAAECVIEKNFPRCNTCKNNGHYSYDCLVKPKEIERKIVKNEKCTFCRKNGHFYCRKGNSIIIGEYDSEEVNVSDDTDYENITYNDKPKEYEHSINSKVKSKTKRKKPVFSNLADNLIKFTNFCPKCAEKHIADECDISLKQNDFDKRRSIYTKSNNYINYKNKKSDDFQMFEGSGFTSDDDSYSNVFKKVFNKKDKNDKDFKVESWKEKETKGNRTDEYNDIKFNHFVNNKSRHNGDSKYRRNNYEKYAYDKHDKFEKYDKYDRYDR